MPRNEATSRRGFLRGALLEDLLLLVGDLLDLFEELVALLGQEDFLAAKLLGGKLAQRLGLLAEDFVDEGHGGLPRGESWGPARNRAG